MLEKLKTERPKGAHAITLAKTVLSKVSTLPFPLRSSMNLQYVLGTIYFEVYVTLHIQLNTLLKVFR